MVTHGARGRPRTLPPGKVIKMNWETGGATTMSASRTFWGAPSEHSAQFAKAAWQGHGIRKQLGAASLQPRGGD